MAMAMGACEERGLLLVIMPVMGHRDAYRWAYGMYNIDGILYVQVCKVY
jgi:hypothetical protein